jgi:GH35 family endo-1,4-beta-xylanase
MVVTAALVAASCTDPLPPEVASGSPAAEVVNFPVSAGPGLREAAARRGVMIGGAVNAIWLGQAPPYVRWSGDTTQKWNGEVWPDTTRLDVGYRDVVERELSLIKPEFHFLWAVMTPRRWDWDGGIQSPGSLWCDSTTSRVCLQETQAIIDFARARGMKVHLPGVITWNYVPVWIARPNKDPNITLSQVKANMDTAMSVPTLHYFFREHIQRLVRWAEANGVDAIDVVNEALKADGTAVASPFVLLKTEAAAMGIVADDLAYVEMAFRYAREASNGSIKLFINENGVEMNDARQSAKSQAYFDLVYRLWRKGLIDGVGFQMHYSTAFSPSAAQLDDLIRKYTWLSLRVRFTEVDYGSKYSEGDGFATSQAEFFRRVVDRCVAHSGTCDAVTQWGVSDRYTWLRTLPVDTGYSERGLMWDRSHQPRPAYERVRNTLVGEQYFQWFSEDCYLANNPDVEDAVVAGTFSSGWEHYSKYGKWENRTTRCHSPWFDEEFYRVKHPDVRDAINAGIFRTARSHYERYGRLEGRQDFLNEACYFARNPDVPLIVATNRYVRSARDHYLYGGAQEGRATTCP